jgi:type IV pilus assembly protein PilC
MAQVLDATTQKKKLVTYRYEATTGQGQLVKGTIKAIGEIEAERLLIQQGYRPVNVEVVPSMWSLEEALPTLFRIKPQDVIVFSRQLATLLRSGFSLLPALEILRGQATTGRTFKKTLESIVDDLRGGNSFSQAVSKHPKAFSEIYTRTIAVGEQTGSMEIVLNQMADYMEKQGSVTKKIKSALTYPVMVLGIGLVVCAVLVVFIMPKMMGMFKSMGVALPLPTQILMGVSDFVVSYPLYLIITGAVLAAVILWMVKRPSGRRILDRIKLTAPLIGLPTLLSELARFARTMSVLVSAGLSLQEIMEVVPHASNNKVIQEALDKINQGLILGEGLSEPMTRIDIFPPLLVQMVSVGEESNTLDFTMGVVADFYEVTAEEKVSAMVGMLGPISTIGIALFVGLIALSVLMPMYSLMGTL